jgi:glycosyltransferase involved in cell wall biosynthesis
MKLSIITINLNNQAGLRRTIESVVSQTFKGFEWIVIDGGSTDGSKELIKQYSEHFYYWISESDKGIYDAMNKGIKVAKGEYLLFLNSGDALYSNEVLWSVFSSSDNKGEDILYGDVALCRNNTMVDVRKYCEQLSFNYLVKYSIAHCCAFIRRDVQLLRMYDETFVITADRKFFIQSALMGYKFRHIPIIVARYDLSGVSSTNEKTLQIEEKRIIKEIIPSPILFDIERLSYFEDLQLRSDDILTIKIRHRYPLFRKLTTFAIKLVRKFVSNVIN